MLVAPIFHAAFKCGSGTSICIGAVTLGCGYGGKSPFTSVWTARIAPSHVCSGRARICCRSVFSPLAASSLRKAGDAHGTARELGSHM